MTGNQIARISLRIDAVYCVLLGLLVAVSTPSTTSSLVLPPALLIGAGVGTTAWGCFVWVASNARPLRARTRLVMIANLVASTSLAATGLVAGTVVLSIAVLALAVDVAAFAFSQGVALRRMTRPAG